MAWRRDDRHLNTHSQPTGLKRNIRGWRMGRWLCLEWVMKVEEKTRCWWGDEWHMTNGHTVMEEAQFSAFQLHCGRPAKRLIIKKHRRHGPDWRAGPLLSDRDETLLPFEPVLLQSSCFSVVWCEIMISPSRSYSSFIIPFAHVTKLTALQHK